MNRLLKLILLSEDGAIPWYLSGGVPQQNAILAYSPEGVSSIDAGYVNQVTPGTYNATPETAPTWDAVNGWKFAAESKQYLSTGYTPDGNKTTILKINNFSGANRQPYGAQAAVDNTFNIYMTATAVFFRLHNQSYSYTVTLDTGPHTIGVVGGIPWNGGEGIGGNAYVDGHIVGFIGEVKAAPTYQPLRIGRASDVDNYYFQGNIQKFGLYNGPLTLWQIKAILGLDVARPTWTHGITGMVNQHASLGNKLQKERTDAWSFGASFNLWNLNYSTLLFTNVTAAGPYPGYELFVNNNGRIHVRIMNSWNTNMIGVIGTTKVCDGNKHVVWATYDGSSTAAGVKIYLDGVLETATVEYDTLSGTTVAVGQDYTIASQQGEDDIFWFPGTIGWIVQHGSAKDQTYVTSNSDPDVTPEEIAGCELRLAFDERSGTTAYDSSGEDNHATLTSAAMWS